MLTYVLVHVRRFLVYLYLLLLTAFPRRVFCLVGGLRFVGFIVVFNCVNNGRHSALQLVIVEDDLLRWVIRVVKITDLRLVRLGDLLGDSGPETADACRRLSVGVSGVPKFVRICPHRHHVDHAGVERPRFFVRTRSRGRGRPGLFYLSSWSNCVSPDGVVGEVSLEPFPTSLDKPHESCWGPIRPVGHTLQKVQEFAAVDL